MPPDDRPTPRPPAGHRSVTEAAVHAFATLTGDYSRMHLDHEFARDVRGGPPIAHGLLVASWALGMLTRMAPERLLVAEPRARIVEFECRFEQVVAIGDTLALSGSPVAGPASGSKAAAALLATVFEVVNQHGDAACSGEVRVQPDETRSPESERPQPWPVEDWQAPASPAVFYAEDLLECGPRGEAGGVTITEADCVNFAREMGETNPRYLDADFAGRTPVGERCAPPMLIFSLGFAAFLEQLLSVPMPAAGFAGHLGDAWHSYAPVRIGDRLRIRHRPLGCRPSRSRPKQAIVEFGLQFVDQRGELVQTGRVAMMIPRRPTTAA